jgi:hypothetical protein
MVLTCPVADNYTDEETFLDHLQRNPRLQPYEFWSLMASLTVIVQHIASVAIFCCSFVAIFQERVSPVSIVGWASFYSFLAWVLWDYWIGQEEAEAVKRIANGCNQRGEKSGSASTPLEDIAGGLTPLHVTNETSPPYSDPTSSLSPRNQQRLATAKSAMLIYAALLGLSPILKSLTRSTTSDSIWAFSTWLLCMNVAFFDYSSGTGAQYVHFDLRHLSILITWQPSGFHLNQLCPHGFHCASITIALNYSRLLVVAIFYRGLRPLPHLPSSTPRQIPQGPPRIDCCASHYR